MNFDNKRLWEDNHVMHENRLPSHSHIITDADFDNARKRDYANNPYYKLLNVNWDFRYYKSVHDIEDDFEKNTDSLCWEKIEVPGTWQTSGYDKPLYVNRDMPFPLMPPYVPDDNPAGVYRTFFEIDENWTKRDTHITFDGVDSCFYLWINGKYCGYSQGSHMPGEFDISSCVKVGRNELVCCNLKWCDGSYLEGQDKWRLNGIFRNVYLQSLPKLRINDVTVRQKLETLDKAEVDLHFEMSDFCTGALCAPEDCLASDVKIYLRDANNENVWERKVKHLGKSLDLKFELENPVLWSFEKPNLYHLGIEYNGCDQVICIPVGIRKIETYDKQIWLNEKSVKIYGMNRHDFNSDTGYYVTKENMLKDLVVMKQNNINAIRTSHYPNDPEFLYLCNEIGFMVMDEADVETHEFQVPGDYSRISADPDWEMAFLDRAERMVKRDINFPCVLFWSLGNESGFGCNQQAMSRLMKEIDGSRPVHYLHAMDDPCVDIMSRMYSKWSFLEETAAIEDDRPFIQNEYGHAMGNSLGSLDEYIKLFKNNKRLAGGFIWEFCEHGFNVKAEDGSDRLFYGGDFGDEPNDGNFCIDGIVDSYRNPRPGMYEYKKLIQPVSFELIDKDNGTEYAISIKNEYLFNDFGKLSAMWYLYENGNLVACSSLKLINQKPSEEAVYHIETEYERKSNMEYYLEVSVMLSEDEKYASKGHEIAFEQWNVSASEAVEKNTFSVCSVNDTGCDKEIKSGDIIFNESDREYIFTVGDVSYTFEKRRGKLTSLTKSGKEMLVKAPTFNAWRAPTDNDIDPIKKEGVYYEWLAFGLDNMLEKVVSVETDGHSAVKVKSIWGKHSIYANYEVELE